MIRLAQPLAAARFDFHDHGNHLDELPLHEKVRRTLLCKMIVLLDDRLALAAPGQVSLPSAAIICNGAGFQDAVPHGPTRWRRRRAGAATGCSG
jgi:hypothetical protein